MFGLGIKECVVYGKKKRFSFVLRRVNSLETRNLTYKAGSKEWLWGIVRWKK
jgi:hypothetical protein